MQIFLIGAAGGIGLRLTRLLTAHRTRVTGMHRSAGQADAVTAAGGDSLIGDLICDDVATLASAMAGHDAVVFSAGAHGTGMDQTTLIDGRGLEKAAAAAARAGVARFVLVSALPEAGRGADLGERFEHYLKVKKAAEIHLVATDLDWVILRPGTLRDEPGDGLVTAGPAVLDGSVRRDNVAAFIAAILGEPALSRRIIELTDGATPVAEAAAALASWS
jgi:uncharacterized protein YbjT (DUF2867 family)